MKRREFLKLLGAGTIALGLPTVAAAPDAPATAPVAASGWASDTLTRGDVFTIQGVYAVNPLTGRETGFLQQFVVTATVTSDDADVQCWPPVNVSRRIWETGEAPQNSVARGRVQ